MTGKTHAIVGANAAWIAVLFGSPDSGIFLALVGAIAGLLPDIDAGTAKIHFLGGSVLGAFRGIFKHRGFFHSILATLGVFFVSFFFLTQYHPLLPFVATLGYFSHLVIDSLNFTGVPYLFPLPVKFRFLPRFFRSPVRGFTDQILFIAGVLGLLLFLLQQYQEFSVGFGSIEVGLR